MNLLLDSHVFKWWRDEPNKLSPTASAEISNPNNNVFLSVVTVREFQIKIALNKFTIKGGLEAAVKDEQQNNDFQILPSNFRTLCISKTCRFIIKTRLTDC